MGKTFGSALELKQLATPANPPSGANLFYVKSDGLLYTKTSAGAEAVANVAEAHDFSMSGTLTTRVGAGRLYVEAAYDIISVRASVGTAPTGAAILVDVNKNGTTVYTTQGGRPSIAISGFTATGNSPDVTSLSAGDYLTVDLDQVGSTIAGADLTVTIRLRRTS